jgi:hypothetical protein
MTDYTCIVGGDGEQGPAFSRRIGVSVTRAMAFGVVYNESMAMGLLKKKMRAIESSNKHVVETDRWQTQILHIMCSDCAVANVLERVVRLLLV